MGDDDRTEQQLLERFKGGDASAFEILFEENTKMLERRAARFVGRKLRRRISVADLIQETRLTAFQRRDGFQPNGAGGFRNWLLGIVEMKGREAVRRHQGTRKREAGREVSRDQRLGMGELVSRLPSPSEMAMAAELRGLVREALAALPEDYREVLRLAREEQLPLREAATRMGRSREAAKKLYGRALCRFKKAFDALRGGTGYGERAGEA